MLAIIVAFDWQSSFHAPPVAPGHPTAGPNGGPSHGAGTGGPDSNGSLNGRKAYKKDPETGRFRKGTAGGGAPYGNHNHPSRAIRERALEIITDTIYQDNLLLRARAGMLAPAMAVALYHYAIGKPREIVEHQERPAFRIVFQGPRRDPLADGGDQAQGAAPMLPPVPTDDGAEGGATETPL